jgi:hypothetical protein
MNIGAGVIVAPGNSIGTLTLDGSQAGGVAFCGELDVEVAGLGSFDILKVLGAVHFDTCGAKVKFIFVGGYTPNAGDTFDFLDGVFDGTFSFTYEGLDDGYAFRLDENGNLVTVQTPGPGAVPVPGSLLLTLFGLGGLGFARRARERARPAAAPAG